MENIIAGFIVVFTFVVAVWGFWYESYGPDEDENTYNEKMFGQTELKKRNTR